MQNVPLRPFLPLGTQILIQEDFMLLFQLSHLLMARPTSRGQPVDPQMGGYTLISLVSLMFFDKNNVNDNLMVDWLTIVYLSWNGDAAQALGLPFLSPYLQSIGSDYRHGVSFATSASTVLQPNTSLFVNGVSPFYLAVQINQMKQFKARVEELKSQGNKICFMTTSKTQN